jgi:hypothetical protein
MDNEPLSAELEQLESALCRRSLPTVPSGLRHRVLDDLQSRLRREQSQSRWQFAAAVAVAAMIWMNLSLSATQATDFGFRLSRPSECENSDVDLMHRIIQPLHERIL